MTLSFNPEFSRSILTRVLTSGRFEGCTWGELCKQYPSYVWWALENWKSLTESDREELYEELESHWPDFDGDDPRDPSIYEQFMEERD